MTKELRGIIEKMVSENPDIMQIATDWSPSNIGTTIWVQFPSIEDQELANQFMETYVKCFWWKKWGILIKMESESLIFTGLEIQREYLYETGVHIKKNKLGNTWWQKQAHVSYARMCVMDTYASV